MRSSKRKFQAEPPSYQPAENSERTFFRANLSGAGRVVRAVIGIGLVGIGIASKQVHPWICFPLVLSGGFVLFEAARGWCLLRACGFKTKL